MAERVGRPRGVVWFEETQRFGRGILAVVLPVPVLFWIVGLRQLVGDRPVGTNPAPGVVLFILWALIGVGLPLLFISARLQTIVGPDGLHLRHFPLHLQFRRWPFEEIERAEPRTYSPLWEYGGWGIRLGGSGWAYNVKGNRGVQLALRSGKRILIGSQDAEALAAAIAKGRSR